MATEPASELVAELRRVIGTVDYPTDRAGLLAGAKRVGVSQHATELLETLPLDEFGSEQDVIAALQWRDALTT
jgi:hypothetical protein